MCLLSPPIFNPSASSNLDFGVTSFVARVSDSEITTRRGRATLAVTPNFNLDEALVGPKRSALDTGQAVDQRGSQFTHL